MTLTERQRHIDIPTEIIELKGGYASVTCEPVNDTWAITPGLTVGGRFTGQFMVTHRLTGLCMPGAACIGCARLAGQALAAIDWLGDWDPDDGPVPTPTAEVRAALACLMACIADYCEEETTP